MYISKLGASSVKLPTKLCFGKRPFLLLDLPITNFDTFDILA